MSSDHLLELLFSQSLDGFFFMMLDEPIRWDDDADKEGLLDYAFDHQRMTLVNDAMLAQYGAAREQFIGVTPRALFAHDLARGRHAWRELFDRGQLHVNTHERRLDGTPIDIEGDYICLYDDTGRVIGHFGIQRDVTEQVRLQTAVSRHAAELETRVAERTADLFRSESRLRAIVNALPDLLFVVDGDGRYLEIVTETPRLLYRQPDQMLGRRFHDVLPPAAADVLLATVRRTIETRATQAVEYALDVDGGQRWYEGRTAVVSVDPPERAPHVVFIARDITDRKRADELERQNVYLREAFDADLHFGEIVGRSAAMQQVFRSIALVADTDSSVLLLGETGTGKELIARAVHRMSGRRSHVMVKVNCAALPATLVESELFGHERGAFTGAVQQKKGRFELAHNGTIFLDEVGELPLEAQVKLLRVLQEQEFERVGGAHTVRVNTRVVAATNRNLADEVRRGAFRSDLFFRLNIFPIDVPPLRARRDDIPVLVQHFVRQFSERLRRRVEGVETAALEQLIGYAWPGNVRELANVLERAVILCDGRRLQSSHLALASAAPVADDLCSLEEAERRHIVKALERSAGVLAGPNGAAALLGVNRSTLWSRMRKLGVPSGKWSVALPGLLTFQHLLTFQ
jgi:formate hydrogenlyase transcriptional activator